MFIDNEQKPTLRSALIILSSRIRATENIVIRTDPHSSLKSLVQDRHLSEENITLELGSPKNLNKNAVAEKAIQELRREILSLCPGGGKISDLTLAKALQSLNTRIRHTGRSSRELWLRRDQVSGEPLNFQDKEISSQQYSMRQASHQPSAKHSSRNAPLVKLPSVQIGDEVFIKSDRSKSKARDPFLVLGKDQKSVFIQKIANNRNRQNVIPVHLQNVYRTPSSKVINCNELIKPNSDDAVSNVTCFYCKNMHRLDNHAHDECPFLPTIVSSHVPQSCEDSSSSDDENETHTNSTVSDLPLQHQTTRLFPPDPVESSDNTLNPIPHEVPYSPPLEDSPVPFEPVGVAPLVPEPSCEETDPTCIADSGHSPSVSKCNKSANSEPWFTPKGHLSPRDRRAIRSSAKGNHSSKLPDGSLIFRGRRFLSKKCSLCD